MVLRLRLLAMLVAVLVCRMTAQTNPPQQVQVGQTVSQGLLVYKVQPMYPPRARQARAQGTVVLQAVIGKDGTIEELSVISGHPLLTQAAVDAVKQWRYKPYLLNGEPVLVQTTINVNFELNGPAPEVPPNEPAASSSSSESRNSNPPSTPQAGQDASSDQSPGVQRVGGDVSAPKLTYGPDPPYSEEARKAHYEGTVVLWLVVDVDGLPQKIRVQRSLGMGLDEEAINTVKQWRFQPATKGSKPVPVMINVEVNFRLFILAPPPADQQNPQRFPGVDGATYPLVVQVRSHFWATVTEEGKERQVTFLPCKPGVRTCGEIQDGTYPAKWMDDKDHIEILGLEDGQAGKWGTVEYTLQAASSGNNGFDRVKGISLHMLPKRVADLGPFDWGLVVSHAGDWKPPQQPPVFQNTHDFLLFVRAQNQQVQDNGVWIVVTDPDAYSDAEKTFLEDIKALCRKEKIPLFICRGIDLPNGWKRYDQ